MQRALIVDDSKTAQIRLKKMLERFNLIVDIAFSAEEALGYLSYRMPAVIFMDHHMEGMDGFEALKIIKANPNTAMIPVIMYTAQKGDVYVGQARALGALDILSKEVIKPSSLERVLSSLKITPRESSNDDLETEVPQAATASVAAPAAAKAPDPKPRVVASAPAEDPALAQVRSQVARLFEMHIADVRQQIADNSRFLVRKINADMDKRFDREPTVGDVPLSVVNAEMEADQRRASALSSSLLFLIFIGLGVIGYELFDTRQELSGLAQRYDQLVALNVQNQELVGSLTESLAKQPSVVDDDTQAPGMMDALSWALDTDMQFDYNTQPLSEQQMLKVSNLVYRLASAGFSGGVELNIHFGNFCLQPDDAGNLKLAEPGLPAEDCVMLADLNPEYSASDYLSLPYLNFEQNAIPVKEGLVDLNVTTSGLNMPRYEYPQVAPGMTAGAWNAIAMKNNRVSIGFSYL